MTRPLLVTDKGVVAAGLAERTLAHLENAVLFDEVRANPDIELVGRARAAYVEAGCDGLVALGGGSSMDTAKSVGVEVVHGGSIVEYEYGGAPISTRSPPLVAGATTAGTRSEATPWAAVTGPQRKSKVHAGGAPLSRGPVAG